MNQSKTLSVIGALQTLEIIAGTLLVTTVLKVTSRGYSQNLLDPKAVWIRESGWMLIGVPIIWLLIALLISSKTERIKSIIISGAVIMIGLLVLYVVAILGIVSYV